MTTETDGWTDLNTYTTPRLLSHLAWLRQERTHKEAASLKIEARAYELRIAAAERMLAIHNRRATEAEDQRVAEERTSAALSERDQEILSVLIDDVQAFGAGDDDDRKDERFQRDTSALLRRLKRMGTRPEVQPALTADEVRAVVREAALPMLNYRLTAATEINERFADDIAARVAEKLAGRGVSAEQRELQEWAIDVVFDGPPGPEAGRFVEVEDMSGKSVGVGQWINRGNGMWALRIPRAHPAQREAELREAFLAGAAWMSERTELGDGGAGFHVIEPSQGKTDDAAAEYARSKAGG